MDRPVLKASSTRGLHHRGGSEQIGSELAQEMRRRWSSGECPAAEEFLSLHPELSDRPQAAVDVIYEEYCQRESAGQEDVEQDILRRFPQWAAPLRVMFDCHHQLLRLADDQPKFPACGECLGEFRLLAELGRGSRGRVFLATQVALADRPVVLKVAPLDGGEHLSLARLQHTNIVPLYSVTDDAKRRIRVLCMPYFGKATLASLLESLAAVPLAERTGQHLVAMDRVQDKTTPTIASAARQMLASVSYPHAMSWLTACLADALQFAHERGIVHLDLKPSNVLLASDGQPMLLDFHLAREPILPGAPLPENIGGTRPYMPPEQQVAMQSLQDRTPIEVAVDARADIYALGAMLYESLGGSLPPSQHSPALSEINPQVSVGLSDIVAKCGARLPEERYATAGALAEDLRRHLTNQPLAGVTNRNIGERWNKWRRRQPGRLRTLAMIVLIVAAATTLLSGKWSQLQERRQQAEFALRDGQRQLDGGHVAEAKQTFERGLALAGDLPFQRDLERDLRDHLTSAKRLQLGQQIHQLAEEVRALYGADSIPPGRLRAVGAQCDAFWDKRQMILDALGATRASDIAPDFMDIAIFAADVRLNLSENLRTEAPEDALKSLQEAEAIFGPNPVLQYERRAHASTAAPPDAAAASSLPTAAPALQSPWEHYALGRALMRCGDLSAAARELARALELEPAGRWPNFYYGVCAYRMKRYDEAISAFSVCIGSAPNIAACFYNRALAYSALGHDEKAFRDYDRALQIDPTHAHSALNRGVLHLKQGHHQAAIADLNVALQYGADAATANYDLALAYLATNNPTLALEHSRRSLKVNPTHEAARQLRDSLEQRDAASGRKSGG